MIYSICSLLTGANMTIKAQSKFAEKMTLNHPTDYQEKGCTSEQMEPHK